MKLRIMVFLLIASALFVAHLPAALMDGALARISDGKLRIAAARGSVWQGSGLLAISDGQRRLRAMRTIDWRFGIAPRMLGLTLVLQEHGRPQADLRLGIGGIAVERLALDLPLDLVAASIAHPVARAGWRGRLVLASDGLSCDWRQTCEGALRVRWHDAGLDIVPERKLGTHEIRFTALGRAFDIAVNTLDGDIRVDGNGRLEPGRAFSFSGSVEGDPEIVDRMPNIMDRNARLTDTPGRVLVTLP
ncbi:MAG TPA: type II secretion system protein N [Rhodocyclaceae bacterium]|nr:type II secretion system protein N [Rhodocyclaceae bacterium]